MRTSRLFLLLFFLILHCFDSQDEIKKDMTIQQLAEDVKSETLRAWQAYCEYGWGYDELLPLSKGKKNWYNEPLYISLIDAYSTLKIMDFEDETQRIEKFVIDSISFDKDIYVKTFEVNIRILGGLLSMYDFSGKVKILEKAEDFANRILPAFNSKSGLPYYYVNLKTGQVKGDTICAAEAGSYLLEMGILSYYTGNPKYYQIAKKATQSIYSSRTDLGLLGQNYNVKTGQALDSISQIGCYVDSYYEYLFKSWLLFGDEDLKKIWDNSITSINKYISFETDTSLWYGTVNSFDGNPIGMSVTLWDAYFPALLVYSGYTVRAEKSMQSWHSLWSKNSLLPMSYNFETDNIINPKYYLNPELIESAYYLWYFTNDKTYLDMLKKYYISIKKYCRTDIAYAHIEDVRNKIQSDQLSTFFYAETMKYFYLAFCTEHDVNLDNYVFSTEAHPFKIQNFKKLDIKIRLDI